MLRQYIWKELAPWFLLANFLFGLGRFVATNELDTSLGEIGAWLAFAWVLVIQVRTLNDYCEFEQDAANARKVTASAGDPIVKRNLGIARGSFNRWAGSRHWDPSWANSRARAKTTPTPLMGLKWYWRWSSIPLPPSMPTLGCCVFPEYAS